MNIISFTLCATTAIAEVEQNGGIILQEDALFRITGIMIQAFAALLALVGMFAVYKMQVIQNEISQQELLRNERSFQKKNIIDELEILGKQRKFMEQFKQKGTQQQIEEIQKIHIQELELDYGRIKPENDVDSIMYISEEVLPEFAERLQQLENKIEELKRHLNNIDHTKKKIGHKISKKKSQIMKIRKETKQTMFHVLLFLVFCLPVLPLSSLEVSNDSLWNHVNFFLVILIILLSILVLLSIFRTLRTMI